MSDTETTTWPLPPGEDERARAWLRAGGPVGPPPRAAASVCLLRDGAGAVEVLWITRGHAQAVAPGYLAFPGGAVDPSDRRRRADDPGPPGRFAVLARAAARECVEETGLAVVPASLHPVARWVTPEHAARRFDSTFLVGVLAGSGSGGRPAGPRGGGAGAAATSVLPVPPGAEAEVHALGWATPAALLGDVAAGRRRALTPTRAVLARLDRAGGAGSAAAALDRLRREAVLVPVVPRAVWREDPGAVDDAVRGVDLLLPGHAGDVP